MAAAECSINRQGIGGVKLGQTLQQVKRNFPTAKFERTRDGEGVAYVVITLPDRTEIISYACCK